MLLSSRTEGGEAPTTAAPPEKFEAAVKALGKPVFHRSGGFGRFGWRETGEVPLIFFVQGILAEIGADLAAFRLHGVDDLAPQTEATLVSAAIHRQDTNAPLPHRLGRETRVT